MYNFRLHNWEIQASQVVLVVKNPLANERGIKDMGSIPGSGRSPGGGHGNPLQYSYLENPMDRGAWWVTVHGVTRSQTRLKWLYTHTQARNLCPRAHYLLFSHSVMSNASQPHGLRHTRFPCPPSPGRCSNSCSFSVWWHPTISSSVVPFSSCLQSFPATESFMSQLFESDGLSIGASASASVLPWIFRTDFL